MPPKTVPSTIWGVAGEQSASSAVVPTASVTPTRHPTAHHNITDLIPTPLITVNSWDPITETIDIDIQLHNPTWTSVYDVRLIIFTDPTGHLLLNNDNWTPLWDIPGGQIANPFKAYAKTQPNRIFTGETFHQENFQIKCPNNNFNIQFVVDASFPDNCEEPYEISGFNQGFIYENIGSSTTISVNVFDWQQDVSGVKLHSEQITGLPEIVLTHIGGNTWQTQLVNSTGASDGYHVGIIVAESSGHKLYKSVKILIHPGVSREHNPEIVGEIVYNIGCDSIDINGDYAYVSGGFTGIRILDISDPLNPEIVYSKQIERTKKIIYINNYIFIWIDSYLNIYDVSNPEDMVFVSRETGSAPLDWLLDGDTFYIMTNTKIEYYDVSDPLNWIYKGRTYGGDSDETCFDVSENLIVKGTDGDGIFIYDLSLNPTLVPLVGSNQSVPAAKDIAVNNNYAYVTCGHDGFFVVDLNDPTSPDIVDTINEYGNSYYLISISGNHAYVKMNANMLIYDISDPLNLILKGTYETEYGFAGILIHNEMAFLNGTYKLEIVDVSDPANPVELSTVSSDGKASSIAVSNDFALVGNMFDFHSGTFDVKVMDISLPENPQFITKIPSTHYTNDLLINGNYAYVSTGIVWDTDPRNCGLHIVDISNPFTPVVLSETEFGQPPQGIDVFENYVCFAKGAGITVMDITDRTSPVYISTYNPPYNYPIDVKIAGHTTYIGGDEFLTVCDSSDPYSLSFLGEYFTPVTWGFIDLDNAGNVVYVLERDTFPDTSKLITIDVSILSYPRKLDSFELKEKSYNFDLEGNYIYAVSESYGLEILDITDPSNIVLDSSLELGLNAYGIDVRDNIAYIANGYMGILVVKLWD